MLRQLGLASYLFLVPAFALATGSGAPSSVPIREFGGLDTDTNPMFLKRRTPDSQNVRTDVGPGVQGTNGFVDYSTQTAADLWRFHLSNGNRYLISRSSDSLKATLGNGTFDVQISTVPLSVRIGAAQLGDYFYWTSATDGLKRWDGTTVSVASRTLGCTDLVSHKTRLWCTGDAGNERTIYVSAAEDGADWAIDTFPADTDPARYVIGGALDEGLSDIYGPFQDRLVWYKDHSFGFVSGSDRSDFHPEIVSREIGTAYPESVKDCDGFLRWLGPNRTIWEWGGGSFSPENEISSYREGGGIHNLLDTVLQGDANSRSWTQTSQDDWESGSLDDGLSAAPSVGDVVFSTSGSMHDDFSDGNYTSSPSWVSSISSVVASVAVSGEELTFTVSNASGAANTFALYSSSFPPLTSGFVVFNFVSETIFGGSDFAMVVLSTQPSGTAPDGIGVRLHDALASTDNAIQKVIGGSLNSTLSTFSKGFGAGTNYEVKLEVVPDGTTSVYVDGSLLSSVSTSAFSGQRFQSIHFGIGTGGVLTSHTYGFDLVRFSTGEALSLSPAQSLGTSISSFGQLTGDHVLADGGIDYIVYTDTDTVLSAEDASSFTSSQTVVSGGIVTLATAPYARVAVNFTRTASTQTPTLSEFTLRWNEGSTLKVASIYADQRYGLAVAISSTSNNRWLWYDWNREWQLDTSLYPVVTALVYNGAPYFGNDAGIWQMGSGYTQDGTAISSYYVTPTHVPTGLDVHSNFSHLFVTTERSDATLATVYYLDGRATENALASKAMNLQTGNQNFKLSFPLTQRRYGKTISLKWSVTSSSAWRILAGNLDYWSDIYAPLQ